MSILKIFYHVRTVLCIRDSKEETEEWKTMTICLVRVRTLHRVLENCMKQNTLQHIYHYHAIFPTKSISNFNGLSIFKFYQYSNSNAILSFLSKISSHHVGHTVAISYSTVSLISRYRHGGGNQELITVIGRSLLTYL